MSLSRYSDNDLGREMDQISQLFKIIIIGDAGCGKTNILNRYSKNEFDPSSKPTIGVEFGTKTIQIDKESETNVKQQIWDTAGQERFRGVAGSYYKGSMGVMLVYDITDQRSFDNLGTWMKEVRNYGAQDLTLVVVGNKKDLKGHRQVTSDAGKDYAQSIEAYFQEVSALDNSDGAIDKAFHLMATDIYSRCPQNDRDESEFPLSSAYGGESLTRSNFTRARKEKIKKEDDGCAC